MVDEQTWQEIASNKQKQRDLKIPDEWKKIKIETILDIEANLTPEEREITLTPAFKLAQKMSIGELKVRTVVEAFCKRASFAQTLTNCLTEVLFKEALERADELDRTFSQTPEKGLLYGVPFSVKDSVNVEGFDSTIGYVSFCGRPASENAVIYDCIIAQGGVVIAKTNVPQSLMAADSVNNVWGRTTNPYNRAFTAGGSSGGEGALVACHGSAIGVGTDIAGSIRIPAMSCGTFALRPSAFRIPNKGQPSNARLGDELIEAVTGPLANNPRDLLLMWQAVLTEKPWLHDPIVHPLPFKRDIQVPTKLRVGYFNSFGDTLPHPPVLRGISETVAALKEAGHDVFEVKDFPQDFARLRSMTAVLLSLDAYESTLAEIGKTKEPVIDVLQKFGILSLERYTAEDIIKARAAFLEFQASAMASLNAALPGDFDVLICPAAPYTAVPHDTWAHADYTVLWNALDLPAAIIPVTTVDPAKDQPRDHNVTGKSDLAQLSESLWDPSSMAGLPVCIQVVGKKFHEEELLASVVKIDETVNVA